MSHVTKDIMEYLRGKEYEEDQRNDGSRILRSVQPLRGGAGDSD
jgi:hypothetical protein